MGTMTSMAANPFEEGSLLYQSPGVLDFSKDFYSDVYPHVALFWTKNAPVVNPGGSGTWQIDPYVRLTITSDTTDLVNDAPTWWNDFFTKIDRSPRNPGQNLYYGTVTDSFDAATNLSVWERFAGLMVYTGEVLVSGNIGRPIHLNSDTTLRFTDSGVITLGNPDADAYTHIVDLFQYQPPTIIAPTDFDATVRVVPTDAQGGQIRWDINRGAQLSVEVTQGGYRESDILRTNVSSLAEFPWLNNIQNTGSEPSNAPFQRVYFENTSNFAMDLTAMAGKSIYDWTVAANATIEGDDTLPSEYSLFPYSTITVLEGVELSTRGPSTITKLNLDGTLTVNHPTTVKDLTVAGSSAVSVAANQTLTVPQILFKNTDMGTLTLAEGARLTGHGFDPIEVTFKAVPPMSSNNPWMTALQNYTYGLNLTIKGSEGTLSNAWLNASKRLTLDDSVLTAETNATLPPSTVINKAKLILRGESTVPSNAIVTIKEYGDLIVAEGASLTLSESSRLEQKDNSWLTLKAGATLTLPSTENVRFLDNSGLWSIDKEATLRVSSGGWHFPEYMTIRTNAVNANEFSNLAPFDSVKDRLALQTTGDFTNATATIPLSYQKWIISGTWHIDAASADSPPSDEGARILVDDGGVVSVEEDATLHRELSIYRGGLLSIAPGKTLTVHKNITAYGTLEFNHNANIRLEEGALFDPYYATLRTDSDNPRNEPWWSLFAGNLDTITYESQDNYVGTSDFLDPFESWQVAGKNTTLSDERLDTWIRVAAGGELKLTGAQYNLRGLTIERQGTLFLDHATLLETNFSSYEDARLATNLTSFREGLPSWWEMTGGIRAEGVFITTEPILSGSAEAFNHWVVQGTGSINTVNEVAKLTTIDPQVTLRSLSRTLSAEKTIDNSGIFQFDTMRVEGTITGAGQVVKVGDGQGVLAKTQTYEGDTIVEGGKLERLKDVALTGDLIVKNGGEYAPVLTAAETNTPRLLRPASRRVVRSATPALPATQTSAGGLHVESGGRYTVLVNSNTNYTREAYAGDVVFDEGAILFVDASSFEPATLATLANVITAGGTFTQHFGELADTNSRLFQFKPQVANNALALVVCKNGTTECSGAEEEEEEPNDTTDPDSAQGIAENTGNTSLGNVGAAVDALVAADITNGTPGRFAAPWVGLTSDAQVVSALQETAPLLSGTTNRALMDAMRAMGKATPWDRCAEAATGKSAWASAIGGWTAQGGSAGAAGFDAHHEGVAVGTDVCQNTWKVGLMGTYTHSTVDSKQTAADQTAKSDAWLLGLYGNKALTERVDVDFGAAAGRARVKGTRNITFAHETAKSTARATLLSAGAGLNWHLGTKTFGWTPFVRADYQAVRMGGYTESGSLLALSVDKQTSDSLVLRAGVKLTTEGEKWAAFARVSAGVDVLDNGYGVTARFANAPATAQRDFTVENTRHGRAVGEVELGGTYHVTPTVDLSAGVGTMLRQGRHDTDANVKVTVKF